jgi:hypothetical protein
MNRPLRSLVPLASLLVVAPLLAIATPAAAQNLAPNDGARHGERNGQSATGPASQHATPSLPTAARLPWPRLEAGATVCQTRDDLRLEADLIQARVDGVSYAGAPPNCQILGQQTPIDIVTRESPAATEIRLKDRTGGGRTAWTSTWLPSQPPR